MPDIMPKPYRLWGTVPPSVRCDVEEEEPLQSLLASSAPEFPPTLTSDEIADLQNQMVGQCLHLKDRVAVLDAPRQDGQDLSPIDVIEWRNRFDARYAALYYPWVRVPDPLRPDELLCDVPPSGHVAGVYARVDRQVGVHKPPANEVLSNILDVSLPIDDNLHGILNDRAVNVIRAYAGRGLRLAGGRTLSSDPEWQYINVRRLLIMIEEGYRPANAVDRFRAQQPRLVA